MGLKYGKYLQINRFHLDGQWFSPETGGQTTMGLRGFPHVWRAEGNMECHVCWFWGKGCRKGRCKIQFWLVVRNIVCFRTYSRWLLNHYEYLVLFQKIYSLWIETAWRQWKQVDEIPLYVCHVLVSAFIPSWHKCSNIFLKWHLTFGNPGLSQPCQLWVSMSRRGLTSSRWDILGFWAWGSKNGMQLGAWKQQ